jgi:hypothetical protein
MVAELRYAGPTFIQCSEVIVVERSEFAKSRQLRGAQGSPQDQVARVPFLLVRFLCLLFSRRLTGQQRK